jgi:hypothetical protein
VAEDGNESMIPHSRERPSADDTPSIAALKARIRETRVRLSVTLSSVQQGVLGGISNEKAAAALGTQQTTAVIGGHRPVVLRAMRLARVIWAIVLILRSAARQQKGTGVGRSSS